MDCSSCVCSTGYLCVEVVLLSTYVVSEVSIFGAVRLGRPPGLDGPIVLVCCFVLLGSSMLLICFGRADGLKATFFLSLLYHCNLAVCLALVLLVMAMDYL